jgi:hypothetical protein
MNQRVKVGLWKLFVPGVLVGVMCRDSIKKNTTPFQIIPSISLAKNISHPVKIHVTGFIY